MLSKESAQLVLVLRWVGWLFFHSTYRFLLENLFCFKWRQELEVGGGRDQQELKANW